MTGRLDRSGAAFFPALATAWQAARAPAQRSSLIVEARWSYPLRLRFPLLATGHIGPRLRKWTSLIQAASSLRSLEAVSLPRKTTITRVT